uniref:Sorting nexin 7 n=4 Tax=Molossus molossus TaxID=27622 RepID=A0A7J8CU81_MOLMO|nr:sorting nexin 7 [Molossus molossus]
MEGELSAAPRRSSGLPDGGAGGDGGDSPSALLPAEALDLDGDEDDLEVFSKDASLMDMNSLSPLMPTSPLSMINQVKFEDEPDLKDLFITVDEPESHVTTIETFITYRIITKTSRGEFDSSEFEVRRRYQDFLWLKGRLEEAHPTLIIPPLPEKFMVKGMVERFNDDFIETRRKALSTFLNRIADHPTLTFNEDFKVFLTAQAGELSSHKKQGPGLLSKVGQTVRAVALSLRGVKSRPEEFAEMSDFIEAFSQKISLIDKISQRICKEEREYFDEMREYGPIHVLWSESEEDLVDTLRGVASCIDRCCRAMEKRLSGLSEALLPVVHEYVLYGEMLMGVMKRRDQIQAELESRLEAAAHKKADTDLLTAELGRLEDRLECANTALKADWERWRRSMRSDLTAAFRDAAARNVQYYEQCLATWESFLMSQTDLHTKEPSEDKP